MGRCFRGPAGCRINRILAEDPKIAVVVITHGANTLEETVCLINPAVKHDRPVVSLGAMRPGLASFGYVAADRVSFL